ncbi:nucleolin-like [Pseudochaenichthys georgianus]|uniref:nucleolin-like n=1 Tax=Pseudochaenichthys georgianus TaxID=52239 RepID=UPI00146C5BC8|nr:glutamic acid-rich protein-like [Pseudochaenichthys georgianus]
MRGENESLFTGAKFSASIAWRTVLEDKCNSPAGSEEVGQSHKRYKDCKCPGSGEGVGGKPTAATWPWVVQMDEILGQRPSICPPVLISSIPEDTPRPRSAVDQEEDEDQVEEDEDQVEEDEDQVEEDEDQVEEDEDQVEEDEDQVEAGPSRPKRNRKDGLMDLIREDMKQQREENRENLNRLFSLLQKLVDK